MGFLVSFIKSKKADYDDNVQMIKPNTSSNVVLYIVIIVFMIIDSLVIFNLIKSVNKVITYKVVEGFVKQDEITIIKELKEVPYEDVWGHTSYRTEMQITAVFYKLYICFDENVSDENSKIEDVKSDTYLRFNEEYEPAYIVIDNETNNIIDIWNQNDHVYVGEFLSNIKEIECDKNEN